MVLLVILGLQNDGPARWKDCVMEVQVIGFEKQPTEYRGHCNCLPIWEVHEVDHGIHVDQKSIAWVNPGGHGCLVRAFSVAERCLIGINTVQGRVVIGLCAGADVYLFVRLTK